MSKTISTVKVLTRRTLNPVGLTPIITRIRSFMPAKNIQEGAGSADWAEITAVVEWTERTNPDPWASPGRAHKAAAARRV